MCLQVWIEIMWTKGFAKKAKTRGGVEEIGPLVLWGELAGYLSMAVFPSLSLSQSQRERDRCRERARERKGCYDYRSFGRERWPYWDQRQENFLDQFCEVTDLSIKRIPLSLSKEIFRVRWWSIQEKETNLRDKIKDKVFLFFSQFLSFQFMWLDQEREREYLSKPRIITQ